MSKVVVIGAGASGIIAALKASENNEVILIDGNDKCGKKLLITGNGKCNYWNEFISLDKYNTDNFDKLDKILSKKEDVLNYLYKIGIYPKVKNGYFYPASGLATSVRELFEKEIERKNILTKYNTLVKDIYKENDKFVICTDTDKIYADKIILATGSKAYPKTGSNGFGYEILNKLGHRINPILPALTSLKTDEMVKEWAGVRTDVSLKLYVNNKLTKEESGEMQLTEDGISGICTFNISSIVSKSLYNNKKVYIKINFVPNIDDFYEFFNNRNKILSNRTIEELLESILNYKLTGVILKRCNINKNSYWNSLNIEEKNRLIKNIVEFELNINDTNSFDKSQVCTGGIPLNELNDNLESIHVNNLFVVGELLDVDGICGGFNLAFAFITGFIVGDNL